MMNSRDLKYLVAIAKHLHFGAAAAACCVSQPALSMQIKKLESMLGVQLIERTTQSVMLTDVGKLIASEAQEILHKIDSLKQMAKLQSDPLAGTVRLGIIPTVAPYLLPHIATELATTFPQLKLYLLEERTENLRNDLAQRDIDAALLALPFSESNCITLPLFNEEFLLAVPPTHELAKRKTVRNTDLHNKVLLLLADGHCLRDAALAVCHTADAAEDKSFQATSLETLRYMVAAKAGITLMPKLACYPNEDVCYIPFTTPKPSRTIGMVWRSSHPKQILLASIVDKIRKLMIKRQGIQVIHTRDVQR
jgi:LysR family transcriptional regulator, hydrogen peroxide-inducible genes activator